MPEVLISPISDQSIKADTLHVFPCPEGEHVHVLMCHENGDVICEMLFEAEKALSIAKDIESAADAALGVE